MRYLFDNSSFLARTLQTGKENAERFVGHADLLGEIYFWTYVRIIPMIL